MKQRINSKQLDELSGNERLKLDSWAIDKGYIEWTNVCHDDECNCAYKTDPLLNIGQMIEFLVNEVNFNLDFRSLDNTWAVRLGEKEFGNIELCDALWEAVKEVLEKK